MAGSGQVMPSGTVTFLFTDIEGSTRLWEETRDAMRVALARHDEIVRSAIQAHGGVVFATGGDGVAAAFSYSDDAVTAAVAGQRALNTERWTNDVVLRVRMGVHTGRADERDGDYFGPPVNRAARLTAAAHGGQIVLSGTTASLLGTADGMRLLDLGTHRLKGVADEMRVFGVDADGAEWLDRPLMTDQLAPGNLPRPATEYIGRIDVLRDRAPRLPSRRVVTLTGSGGVGKTRTAVEVGWLSLDEYPGGVWLVELAPIEEERLVIAAVASALGAQLQPGMSTIASIVNCLHRRRLLLILDNCEHVLPPVAELVSALTAGCEQVAVLATSREPLGVPGERVVAVASLDIERSVELFTDRARALDDSLEVDADDQMVIAEICERLDGIPLAIELAAARVRSMSPAQIRDRLDQRFRLLTGSRRTIDRHQTLRSAVQWSFDLLGSVEQNALQRVSVFAGGFTLAGATATCAVDVDGVGVADEFEMLDVLDSLVRKSLLHVDRSGSEARFGILETVRQFGEEGLASAGAGDSVRDLHANFYADQADVIFDLWNRGDEMLAHRWLGREMANLSSAFRLSLDRGHLDPAVRIAATAHRLARSQLRIETFGWAEDVAEPARQSGHRQLPRLLTEACDSATGIGRLADGVSYGREAIALIDDDRFEPEVAAYGYTGFALFLQGDTDEAMSAFRAGAQHPLDRVARVNLAYLHAFAGIADVRLPDRESKEAVAHLAASVLPSIRAVGCWVEAMLAARRDVPAAITLSQRAIDIAADCGSRAVEENCRGFLLGLLATTDDLDAALNGFTATVSGWQVMGDPYAGIGMMGLVQLLARLGYHDGATELWGAINRGRTPAAPSDAALRAMHDSMGSAAFSDAYETGAHLDQISAGELAYQLIARARRDHVER